MFVPLKRLAEGQILFLNRSIGATARPLVYSMALKDRDLFATHSRFVVRVYPIPDIFYRFRARVRVWPGTELYLAGQSLFNMDDEQGEQLAVWVAGRVGAIVGYQSDYLTKLVEQLPPQLRAEIDLINTANWNFSEPRGIEAVA